MSNQKLISLCLTVVFLLSVVGCEDLPGNRKQQGAVIGGAGGAVAGDDLSPLGRTLLEIKN